LAKDRKPDDGRPKGSGPSRSGSSSARSGKGGRTRPPTPVVAPQRPWGLIAGALAVVLFAAAVITYAVVQVNEANAGKVESVEEIEGIQTYDYSAGQDHVTTQVAYAESPPVGGPHAPPPDWADCTGTVYTVDIRHENAVHSLEHGAVWITYNPDQVSEGDIATLAELAGESGRMLSPYVGLDSPISIQSWNHQLKVDSADDERLKQFADFLTYNADYFPEPGASCENPNFVTNPVVEEAPAAPADGAAPSTP
jgi:hypothetical protein